MAPINQSAREMGVDLCSRLNLAVPTVAQPRGKRTRGNELTSPILRDGIEDTLENVKRPVASIARLFQIDTLEVVVSVETSANSVQR